MEPAEQRAHTRKRGVGSANAPPTELPFMALPLSGRVSPPPGMLPPPLISPLSHSLGIGHSPPDSLA